VDFFTSDTHFGHKNIITFCSRPFETIDEMNDNLIKNWNDMVKPTDRVFVVGDVFLCKPKEAEKYIKALNGYKILILGNHDRSPETMLSVGFDECHHKYTYEMPNGASVLLQHYPIPELLYGNHEFLIHGHVHDKPRFRGKKVNVCTDIWGYKPIPLSVIEDYMESHKEKTNEKFEMQIEDGMLNINLKISIEDFIGLSRHINNNINKYKNKTRRK